MPGRRHNTSRTYRTTPAAGKRRRHQRLDGIPPAGVSAARSPSPARGHLRRSSSTLRPSGHITSFRARPADGFPTLDRPHNGGSALGYLGTFFVSLTALSNPGYGPMNGQPSRKFIPRRARGEHPHLPHSARLPGQSGWRAVMAAGGSACARCRVRLRPHCRRVRRPAQQRGRLRRRRRQSVRHGAPGARAHQAWIWIAGDGGRALPEAVFGNRSDPSALDHLAARYPYRNDPGTGAQQTVPRSSPTTWGEKP
jgi:hypothetical protein